MMASGGPHLKYDHHVGPSSANARL